MFGVKSGSEKKSKMQYRALLWKSDGPVVEFRPYGVDIITENAAVSIFQAQRKHFQQWLGT
jgi:hypothetical protein